MLSPVPSVQVAVHAGACAELVSAVREKEPRTMELNDRDSGFGQTGKSEKRMDRKEVQTEMTSST